MVRAKGKVIIFKKCLESLLVFLFRATGLRQMSGWHSTLSAPGSPIYADAISGKKTMFLFHVYHCLREILCLSGCLCVYKCVCARTHVNAWAGLRTSNKEETYLRTDRKDTRRASDLGVPKPTLDFPIQVPPLPSLDAGRDQVPGLSCSEKSRFWDEINLCDRECEL